MWELLSCGGARRPKCGAITTLSVLGAPLIPRCVRSVAMMVNVYLLKRAVTILASSPGVVCQPDARYCIADGLETHIRVSSWCVKQILAEISAVARKVRCPSSSSVIMRIDCEVLVSPSLSRRTRKGKTEGKKPCQPLA